MARERNHEERRRRRLSAALCGVVVMSALAAGSMGGGRAYGMASADESASYGCVSAMVWPLREPTVTKAFDAPEQPWLPGHRGVDLAAKDDMKLIAPSDGIISFAGQVAGKSVVSLAANGLILTFEPAVTDRDVGARIRQGDYFARVSRGSDHCDGSCVHWGVRRANGDYADPTGQVGERRIALKPVV
ncbi:M23 family metallopeptidase [Bifidobacterium aerophilum]|nr:M23 family metallopeptidase [Bifidobacterium aerophilum]